MSRHASYYSREAILTTRLVKPSMVQGMTRVFLNNLEASEGSCRGPHVDPWHPWPMSHISAIFGTDDDQEILTSLYTIANVRGS